MSWLSLGANQVNHRLDRICLAWAGAALLALTACDGGSDTTSVSTKVVDGAIQNAVVCIDKNSNGLCDADETQGTTAADGSVTLDVPNADVGKYPILAIVGTNAIDADNGPVTTAYTMSAPADQVAVVSPLTTLVQQTVASPGATSAEAAASVQAVTGITTSLFQDFTKAAAPTDGTLNAATVARMLVVAAQRQAAVIAGTVGTRAIDGTTIAQADLDKALAPYFNSGITVKKIDTSLEEVFIALMQDAKDNYAESRP